MAVGYRKGRLEACSTCEIKRCWVEVLRLGLEVTCKKVLYWEGLTISGLVKRSEGTAL